MGKRKRNDGIGFKLTKNGKEVKNLLNTSIVLHKLEEC